MSEIDDGTPARSRFWIWFLVFILVVLLVIPLLSIGLALKKNAWTPVAPRQSLQKTSASPSSDNRMDTNSAQKEVFAVLRERIEKVASAVVKPPVLRSKLQQVQIQAPAPVISRASDSVHAVLNEKKHQFVEAVSPDSIRIVVILPSNEWPGLSADLQNAAERDGFIYRGPNQTATAGYGADSMVAEIEILRKVTPQGKGAKK